MEKESSLKKKKRTPRKTAREPSASLKSFRIVVAYQGSQYMGWQKQAKSDGLPTVQEMIEKAARKVLKRKIVNIHGSGRTDSGVHARAQVAHLRVEADLPAGTLLKAFNAHLPPDIRIVKLEECDEDFHSQLDVTAKTYRYFILNSTGPNPVHWPFLRPYTWFVTYRLDLPAMERALAHLVGTHDFRTFQNRGTPVPDTVREILEARVIVHSPPPLEAPPWMPPPELEARLFEIRVTGTGFLKQMVRNIVGTVVEVGRGRLKPDSLVEMLEQKNRMAAGMTAPPFGLFLDNVRY